MIPRLGALSSCVFCLQHHLQGLCCLRQLVCCVLIDQRRYDLTNYRHCTDETCTLSVHIMAAKETLENPSVGPRLKFSSKTTY